MSERVGPATYYVGASPSPQLGREELINSGQCPDSCNRDEERGEGIRDVGETREVVSLSSYVVLATTYYYYYNKPTLTRFSVSLSLKKLSRLLMMAVGRVCVLRSSLHRD